MVKSYNRGLKTHLHFFLGGDKESFVLWTTGSITALNVINSFSLCFPFILGFVFQVSNIFTLHLHSRPTVRVKPARFGRVVFANKTAISTTYL